LDIKWINIDGWKWVKEAALTTIHKNSIKEKDIPSQWKKDILRSEHSPIRELKIRFKIKELMRWISDQIVRHKMGVEHYVGTMRSDRGNKPREEQTMADLTDIMQSYNAQSFTNFARTRLCVGCVNKETRELTKEIVQAVGELEPEVAFYCVPSCIYRGACKEKAFIKCNHFNSFLQSIDSSKREEMMFDIDKRYEAYHNWRKWGDVNVT